VGLCNLNSPAISSRLPQTQLNPSRTGDCSAQAQIHSHNKPEACLERCHPQILRNSEESSGQRQLRNRRRLEDCLVLQAIHRSHNSPEGCSAQKQLLSLSRPAISLACPWQEVNSSSRLAGFSVPQPNRVVAPVLSAIQTQPNKRSHNKRLYCLGEPLAKPKTKIRVIRLVGFLAMPVPRTNRLCRYCK